MGGSMNMVEEKIFKTHLDFHNQQIALYGYGNEAIANSINSQTKRFEVATQLFKYDNYFSLLDLGAGLCDLYPYLTNLGFEFTDYTAADINPQFIKQASVVYTDINFIKGSVNEIIKTGKNFDYVVASGIYNLGYDRESNISFILKQFSTLFPYINKGLTVNFLSDWSRKQNPLSIYYDPITMLHLFRENFGCNITFYHNYLPHDFTIMIQK
jgi:hypothetical protein